MKKFLILGLFLMMITSGFSQTAVVYSSDDPYSSAAAAVAQQKYSISYLLDVSAASSDSAAQVTWIATLDSLTYAYIFIDTTTLYTADRCQSSTYDSIVTYGYTTGFTFHYLVATTSYTTCERAWDSIYTGVNPPLIILYLSEGDFTEDKFDASGGTDSTIFKANATGWTNDAWNSGYTAYLTAGPGIGSSAVITDVIAVTSGNADTLDFDGTSVFSATVTTSTDAVVMTTSQFNRWGWYDVYSYYGVLVKLADISTASAQDGWSKLLDDNNKLNNLLTGRSPRQDRAYLTEILDVGKNVFDYLVEVN